MSETENQETSSAIDPAASGKSHGRGAVMPIGGAEDKNGNGESSEEILKRFVKEAGGGRARILIIPTASEMPEEMIENYTKTFRKIGVQSIDSLEIEEREQANDEKAIKQIESATGIFITGGNQAKLVELVVGTLAMEAIRRRNSEGVIVAGTSAGASILASHLMLGGTGIGGDSGDTAARKSMVEIAGGFGLLQDIIIDQHFSERGRMGRLLSVFASNPGLLSVGLDEDTAVLIDGQDGMETLGSGMVTVIDGRNARSDFFEREPGEVLTVADSHLSVLGPGRHFDLKSRTAVLEESAAE